MDAIHLFIVLDELNTRQMLSSLTESETHWTFVFTNPSRLTDQVPHHPACHKHQDFADMLCQHAVIAL